MNKNIWGKSTWILIHSIAINYPEYPLPCEKKNTINFFTLLGDMLPCRYCRQNYRENLKVFPIQADYKMDLVWWTIDLHNRVNIETNKPILSREDALKKILLMHTEYYDNFSWYHLFYIGILILLFILIIINKIKN
jgi:FAD-linked sulfhydryl oxidase